MCIHIQIEDTVLHSLMNQKTPVYLDTSTRDFQEQTVPWPLEGPPGSVFVVEMLETLKCSYCTEIYKCIYWYFSISLKKICWSPSPTIHTASSMEMEILIGQLPSRWKYWSPPYTRLTCWTYETGDWIFPKISELEAAMDNKISSQWWWPRWWGWRWGGGHFWWWRNYIG